MLTFEAKVRRDEFKVLMKHLLVGTLVLQRNTPVAIPDLPVP